MMVIRIERNHSPWQAIAASSCFVSAALAFLFGTLFTTKWVLNAEVHPFLHALGLTLLIVAIPTLILGGHCLDLLDKRGEGRSVPAIFNRPIFKGGKR